MEIIHTGIILPKNERIRKDGLSTAWIYMGRILVGEDRTPLDWYVWKPEQNERWRPNIVVFKENSIYCADYLGARDLYGIDLLKDVHRELQEFIKRDWWFVLQSIYPAS